MNKLKIPVEGEPLTREGLFMLLCDEVYKDGKVEDFELKTVKIMAKKLKLSKEIAKNGMATSKARFKGGELGSKRVLNPVKLYAKTIHMILSDNYVDDLENQLIQLLQSLFKIDKAIHNKVLKKMGFSKDPFPRSKHVKKEKHHKKSDVETKPDKKVEPADQTKPAKRAKPAKKVEPAEQTKPAKQTIAKEHCPEIKTNETRPTEKQSPKKKKSGTKVSTKKKTANITSGTSLASSGLRYISFLILIVSSFIWGGTGYKLILYKGNSWTSMSTVLISKGTGLAFIIATLAALALAGALITKKEPATLKDGPIALITTCLYTSGIGSLLYSCGVFGLSMQERGIKAVFAMFYLIPIAIGGYCVFLSLRLLKGEVAPGLTKFLLINGIFSLFVDAFISGGLSIGAAAYLYSKKDSLPY